MKQQIFKYIYIGILYVFFSCNEKIHQKDGMFLIDVVGSNVSKQPYLIKKLVPLETRADNLLKEYLLIQSNEKGFFIMDKEKEDAIYHFDRNGKYIGKILGVGEGPDMLPNIHDFIATDQGLEVLIGKGEKSEIWVYDHELRLVEEKEFVYAADTFAKLPNGYYVLYGGYNKPIVMQRLAIFDPLGNKLEEYLPNDYKNDVLPVGERNFNVTEQGIFFHEFYNPELFEIRESELVQKYELDLGKYAIPEQYWELDWMQGFELINSNGFGFVSHYFENEEKAFIGVNIQADQQIKNHQIILDKRTSKITKRITGQNDHPAFSQLVGLMDGHLLFVAQAADVLNLDRNRLPEPEIKLNKDDNPVLLFVEF
ncbi:hypothetical protein SAMN00777080_3847 [Aquiflexum balticum DSM 16537]|uniref:6-bladed beta-propeller protein n=1 Tax=Aquiflexum balticum DSM 16537 TaxID=758820 RepID=A0A1W2H913_9BACT|nr:6-bladed beta-propeller [Aquiflexum balticum]SMD45202.1 hypothetical protein SAMN00777080_3847 [Aquiflexum balticum DSM 16537]